MKIKSPTLSSRHAAKVLGEFVDHGAIKHSMEVIDRLSEIYDALEQSAAAVSPEETIEARAMRFERDHSAAVDKARKLVTNAATLLDTFAKEAEAMAIQKAGLSSTPDSAQEIRAALRQMTPAAREKAVADAFARGDAEVLASIHGANPVVWGGAKAVDVKFKEYIDRSAPERSLHIQAADNATQILGFATDGLLTAAEQWRNPDAAARGEAQMQHYREAKARLAVATRDYS